MLKARIETVLAVVAGTLAVVTLIWPTWIETLFGVEPDAGSGEAEWWIVVVLALVAVAPGLLARRDYTAARRLSAEGALLRPEEVAPCHAADLRICLGVPS